MFLTVWIALMSLSTAEASPTSSAAPAGSTGYWDAWQPWSNCSETCGMGKRTRERFCLLKQGTYIPFHHCSGESEEEKVCEIRKCVTLEELEIVYKDMGRVPSVIQVELSSQKEIRFLFYCYLPGVPVSRVGWMREGELIKGGSHRVAQHGVERPVVSKRLKIKPFMVDDVGVFTCVVYDELSKNVILARNITIVAVLPTTSPPTTETMTTKTMTAETLTTGTPIRSALPTQTSTSAQLSTGQPTMPVSSATSSVTATRRRSDKGTSFPASTQEIKPTSTAQRTLQQTSPSAIVSTATRSQGTSRPGSTSIPATTLESNLSSGSSFPATRTQQVGPTSDGGRHTLSTTGVGERPTSADKVTAFLQTSTPSSSGFQKDGNFTEVLVVKSQSVPSDSGIDISMAPVEAGISQDENNWIVPIAATVGVLVVFAALLVGCRVFKREKKEKTGKRRHSGHVRSSSFASCDTGRYDPLELGLTVPKADSMAQLSLYLDDSGLIVYGAMGVRRKSSLRPSDAVHAEVAANHKRVSSALEVLDSVVAAAERELVYSSGGEEGPVSVSLKQNFEMAKSVPFEDQPTDSDSTGVRGASLVPVVIVVDTDEVQSQSYQEEDKAKAESFPVETESVEEDRQQEESAISEEVSITSNRRCGSVVSDCSLQYSLSDISVIDSERESSPGLCQDELVSDC